MILSFKPRFHVRCVISYPSIQLKPTLKWVSTKSPPLEGDPLLRLASIVRDRRPRDNKDSNYELALVSALKSCSTHLAISQGRQIHCLVLKSGLDSNTFVRNSLINMYAKCEVLADAKSMFDSFSGWDPVSCNIMIVGYVNSGMLDHARELFDVMPGKGCVPYTSMIKGFSQGNRWSEAIEAFREMRYVGVIPNELTLTSVISACSHLGGIWDCRMLHALVIKMMFDGFVLVSTNLLNMYCTFPTLGEARALFDEMPEKNIVSWNVMLKGYSKAGLVDLARELFERLPDKDVVSWGTVIDGYVRVERLREAFVMFHAMVSAGLGPTEVMLVDLISVCGKRMAIGEGLQLHGVIMKMGFHSYDFVQATVIHFYASSGRIDDARLQFEGSIKDNVASWNALISGFIRKGMIEQARKLFDEIHERDVFSWSTMISGYAQNEQPQTALELFHWMVAGGIKPNEVTMVSVFSAIARLGALEEGRWAHEYVYNNSIPLNDNLSAAIIDMYAKCGSINTALEVFYQIQDRTCTVSPWNTIICGLAIHGHANLSLIIYLDLQSRHLKLNAITFIGVLSACCHAGLVDLGKKFFKSMKSEHSIDPDIRHYGCMVDLLARAGKLKEAEELIMSMPMKADVVIWGTLLAACKTHGNADIGERAAENLARLEPSHAASRVMLSNIYADAGRWEEAFLVRRAMQSHRMQRLPGYSGVGDMAMGS
uniref:Pentatricopeptide repeat-containing protein n=1 Tax=Rhizophora mucronata TaxID=61149 RepID=A0A2P2J6S4_RHIMU